MKSYAFMLGAAVCLVGATALADGNEYWENRDVDPTIDSEKLKPQSNRYWERRDVTPADEDQKPERNYFAQRDTNPGDPDDAREAEQAAMNDPRGAMAPDNRRAGSPFDRDRDDDRIGIQVETGGGVGGFIDDDISETTSAQGQWTGRVVIGTRRHFAGEVAYLGTAQNVNTFGVTPNSKLYGNGAEGAFRFNLLTGMWQPYASAGLGFMHYNFNDSATLLTSDVQRSDTVLTVPVGVGMAWRSDMGLVLDGRLSFHPATSGLIRNANLSTWDLQAKAGFEF